MKRYTVYEMIQLLSHCDPDTKIIIDIRNDDVDVYYEDVPCSCGFNSEEFRISLDITYERLWEK